MPRNVACAHIPLFLTILTKAVKVTRIPVSFRICHIYILCGRIHGNAVGYLNLLIGAVGDKVACEHLHLVYIYHGIRYFVCHRNVAPLCRYHIQQIAIEPKAAHWHIKGFHNSVFSGVVGIEPAGHLIIVAARHHPQHAMAVGFTQAQIDGNGNAAFFLKRSHINHRQGVFVIGLHITA